MTAARQQWRWTDCSGVRGPGYVVLYYESVEGHTVEGASTDSPGPAFVNSLSKTQVDRLGDRLRKGIVAEEDLQQLDAYRRSYAGAYDDVVAIIRDSMLLEPTGRPAKSTTSIIEKLAGRQSGSAKCRISLAAVS